MRKHRHKAPARAHLPRGPLPSPPPAAPPPAAEHPRPRRVKGRVSLVGDAAGYVTKCSGEGIYFAAKSGRMAGEAIVAASQGGKRMAGEAALRTYLDEFDRKYWATYKVLDILQKVFYRSNPAREAFVELCESNYVQKMTFDSYLYKTGGWVPRSVVVVGWGGHCRLLVALRPAGCALSTQPSLHRHTPPPPAPAPAPPPAAAAVVPGNPLDDVKLLVDTVGSLLRANALRSAASKGVNVSFGSKSNEEKLSAV